MKHSTHQTRQVTHRIGASVVAAAPTLRPVLLSTMASAATPVQTGCPAGFALLTLAAQGPYRQPFDAAGNNDGLICGKALNEQSYDAVCGPGCAVPVLYNFLDNKEGPKA